MSTITKRDTIDAALAIAEDVAEGRIDPAELERAAVADLTALVGTVAGPDDPLWSLQVDIARQVLGLGGVPTDELAEWLAVARRDGAQPTMLISAAIGQN